MSTHGVCVCVLWFAPHHSESKELAAAATHPLAAKACRRGHNFTTRCNPNFISAVLQPYWQACGCGQGKAEFAETPCCRPAGLHIGQRQAEQSGPHAHAARGCLGTVSEGGLVSQTVVSKTCCFKRFFAKRLATFKTVTLLFIASSTAHLRIKMRQLLKPEPAGLQASHGCATLELGNDSTLNPVGLLRACHWKHPLELVCLRVKLQPELHFHLGQLAQVCVEGQPVDLARGEGLVVITWLFNACLEPCWLQCFHCPRHVGAIDFVCNGVEVQGWLREGSHCHFVQDVLKCNRLLGKRSHACWHLSASLCLGHHFGSGGDAVGNQAPGLLQRLCLRACFEEANTGKTGPSSTVSAKAFT